MNTPVIETARMRLRVVKPKDLDAYVDLWQEESVLRHTIGTALTRETAWSRILRTTGHWQVFGFGFFVVEDKATGKLIGEAGFHDMKRAIKPSIEGTLEAGWMLLPPYHGKGIAREIMTAAIEWAEKTFPDMHFSAIIDPVNEPSRKLARSLGFAEGLVTEYSGHPTIICRRPGTRQALQRIAP